MTPPVAKCTVSGKKKIIREVHSIDVKQNITWFVHGLSSLVNTEIKAHSSKTIILIFPGSNP